ncbi:hypothetical protein PVAP13_2KG203060 [Panicum virgatum]|uniref:Uncharacterized protein n=1 Tax=Panicum virgatum TaxID=38727 RepID=A0A8T0W7N4_PANVG|nr:hypothetical protein PVAP13_2KG203060 [Panicum virgatum]
MSLVVIIANPHAVIIASCPFSPAVRGAVPSLTWILALVLTEQGRHAGSSFAVGAGAAPRGETVSGGGRGGARELRGRGRSGGGSGAQRGRSRRPARRRSAARAAAAADRAAWRPSRSCRSPLPPPSFLRPPCSRPRTGRQGGGACAAPAEVCAVAERAAVAGLHEIRPRRERARLACSSSGALLGEGAGPSLPIRRSPLAPVASGYLAGLVVAASPRLPPPPPPTPSRRAAGPRAAPAPFHHWICDIEGRSFLAPRAVETGSSTASHLLPPAASPPPPV